MVGLLFWLYVIGAVSSSNADYRQKEEERLRQRALQEEEERCRQKVRAVLLPPGKSKSPEPVVTLPTADAPSPQVRPSRKWVWMLAVLIAALAGVAAGYVLSEQHGLRYRSAMPVRTQKAPELLNAPTSVPQEDERRRSQRHW